MENKDKNFENQWKNAFENAEEHPDDLIWQNIEGKLAQRDIAFYKRKYFYSQAAAAVLLLLLLPLSGYFIYHQSNKEIAGTTKIEVRETAKPSVNEELATSGSLRTSSENQVASNSSIVKKQSVEKDEKDSELGTDKTAGINKETLAAASLEENRGKTVEEKILSNEQGKVDGKGPNRRSNSIGNENVLSHKDFAKSTAQKGLNNKEGEVLAKVNKRNSFNSKPISKRGRVSTSDENALKDQYTTHSTKASKGITENDVESSISTDHPTSTIVYNPSPAKEKKSGGIKSEVELKGKTENHNGVTESTSSTFVALNPAASINSMTSKSAKTTNVKPKQIYLYFWQNESMYVAQAEVKKNDKAKMRKWYANLDFIPSYTNQNFESASSPASVANGQSDAFFATVARTTLDQSTKELEMLSKPEFSFTSGLNGAYRINNKLSIEVGLKYVYSQAKVFTNNYFEDPSKNARYPHLILC